MDAPGELPKLLQRDRELLGGRPEQLPGHAGVGRDLAFGQTEGEGDRHEPLLCAVVQVPLEAAPLDIACFHDALP